ncbi:hypothetical protein LY76DRAFT_271385 [Colletotrichum caudatum]|nr:hypothetical protein LY76DRAFT_271385 [Colletotrichum caudatum]
MQRPKTRDTTSNPPRLIRPAAREHYTPARTPTTPGKQPPPHSPQPSDHGPASRRRELGDPNAPDAAENTPTQDPTAAGPRKEKTQGRGGGGSVKGKDEEKEREKERKRGGKKRWESSPSSDSSSSSSFLSECHLVVVIGRKIRELDFSLFFFSFSSPPFFGSESR